MGQTKPNNFKDLGKLDQELGLTQTNLKTSTDGLIKKQDDLEKLLNTQTDLKSKQASKPDPRLDAKLKTLDTKILRLRKDIAKAEKQQNKLQVRVQALTDQRKFLGGKETIKDTVTAGQPSRIDQTRYKVDFDTNQMKSDLKDKKSEKVEVKAPTVEANEKKPKKQTTVPKNTILELLSRIHKNTTGLVKSQEQKKLDTSGSAFKSKLNNVNISKASSQDGTKLQAVTDRAKKIETEPGQKNQPSIARKVINKLTGFGSKNPNNKLERKRESSFSPRNLAGAFTRGFMGQAGMGSKNTQDTFDPDELKDDIRHIVRDELAKSAKNNNKKPVRTTAPEMAKPKEPGMPKLNADEHKDSNVQKDVEKAKADDEAEQRQKEFQESLKTIEKELDVLVKRHEKTSMGIFGMLKGILGFSKTIWSVGKTILGLVGKLPSMIMNVVKSIGSAVSGAVSKGLGAVRGLFGKGAKPAAAAAVKATEKTAAGAAAKLAGKATLKGVIDSIPVVGGIFGIGEGIYRLAQGDVTGAGIAATAGLVGEIPGFEAIGWGLQGANFGRDIYKATHPTSGDPKAQQPKPEVKPSSVSTAKQASMVAATEANLDLKNTKNTKAPPMVVMPQAGGQTVVMTKKDQPILGIPKAKNPDTTIARAFGLINNRSPAGYFHGRWQYA